MIPSGLKDRLYVSAIKRLFLVCLLTRLLTGLQKTTWTTDNNLEQRILEYPENTLFLGLQITIRDTNIPIGASPKRGVGGSNPFSDGLSKSRMYQPANRFCSFSFLQERRERMKVLLRISRFPVFPAKKKSSLLIAPKCVSANKWEVLHIRVRKCM